MGARRGTVAGARPEDCSGGGSPRLARRRSCNFRSPHAAPPGGPHGPAGSGTQVPSSSVSEDSPQEDDDGAILPSAVGRGPASLVSVDLSRASEVELNGKLSVTSDRRRSNSCAFFSRGELFAGHQPGRAPAVPGIIRVPPQRPPVPSMCTLAGCGGSLAPRPAAIATVRGGGYQFVPGPHAKVRGPAEYCHLFEKK